ncbi:MAG: Holliday junction ATP-dependent DNA helicase RuvB [Parcubacteria group bacterium GW2011_GWF2_40_10]|nr:MAG: Holliday junction ATP-dependent DNA helicase RuvB [Parcubacteria group bacterium GW2011_GWF2_40_10]
MNIASDAATEIAKRSRFTPRIANHFLKRCRDFAQVHGQKELDLNSVEQALSMMEIDSVGLNPHDRRMLEILIEKFGGGPVGVQTLAAASSEEEATIEEVYEPYLLQLGFIDRTPRGRVATPRAYEHLGKKPKQEGLL